MNYSADIFVNLIATLGMFGLWLSVRQNGAMSPVERRISYLAVALMFMFFMRSWFWANNSYTIERIGLIPAVFIPFLVLITTEGLMRRHAPFLMKLLTALTVIIGGGVVILGHRQFEPWFSYGMCAVQFIVFLFCLFWIMTRKAADLTASESRSASIFALTLVCVSLVGLTDFPEIITLPVRLGAVGVLVVAYLLVFTNSRTFSFRDVALELAVISAAVGVALWMSVTVLKANSWDAAYALGVVLFSLLLSTVIMYRVFMARSGIDGQAERILSQASTDTLEGFLGNALASKMTPYSAVLGPNDLTDYNIDNLIQAYEANPVIHDKMLSGTHNSTVSETASEQIEDILSRHQASHSFMASKSPPLIVVSATQPFGDEREFSTYLALVSKIARLIKQEAPA